MDVKYTNPIELVLPGRIDYEWMAIESARTVAAQMDFPDSRIEDVKTVVSEGFLNAIRHGNRGREGRKVKIRFLMESEALRIEITDHGRGFDPDRVPAPQLRKKIQHREPPGGWGLFLIRQLVDKLEVQRRFPFGSSLVLTMRPITQKVLRTNRVEVSRAK